MTYGEAHIKEKLSVVLEKGKWVKKVHIDKKPKPMKPIEASKYYNTKLYRYWLNVLNEEAPKRKKVNAIWIKIKMFGHPDNAKLNDN